MSYKNIIENYKEDVEEMEKEVQKEKKENKSEYSIEADISNNYFDCLINDVIIDTLSDGTGFTKNKIKELIDLPFEQKVKMIESASNSFRDNKKCLEYDISECLAICYYYILCDKLYDSECADTEI